MRLYFIERKLRTRKGREQWWIFDVSGKDACSRGHAGCAGHGDTNDRFFFNSEPEAQDALYAHLQKIDKEKWDEYRIGVLERSDSPQT